MFMKKHRHVSLESQFKLFDAQKHLSLVSSWYFYEFMKTMFARRTKNLLACFGDALRRESE